MLFTTAHFPPCTVVGVLLFYSPPLSFPHLFCLFNLPSLLESTYLAGSWVTVKACFRWVYLSVLTKGVKQCNKKSNDSCSSFLKAAYSVISLERPILTRAFNSQMKIFLHQRTTLHVDRSSHESCSFLALGGAHQTRL